MKPNDDLTVKDWKLIRRALGCYVEFLTEGQRPDEAEEVEKIVRCLERYKG